MPQNGSLVNGQNYLNKSFRSSLKLICQVRNVLFVVMLVSFSFEKHVDHFQERFNDSKYVMYIHQMKGNIFTFFIL